jgi:hypothetical protein
LNEQGQIVFRPVLDSTNAAESSGPVFLTPWLVGEHQVNTVASINTTVCNITPNQTSKQTLTFYAVDCRPKFHYQTFEDGNVVVPRLPQGPPETPIKIHPYTPNLSTAVDAAIAALNPKLASAGINVTLVNEPCAIADGGRCVRVNEAPPLLGACGGARNQFTDPATGYYNTSPLVEIRDDSWDQAYLNWIVTHELTHLLGLANSDCPVDKSVMWGGDLPCGVFPTPPPTAATIPTPSDVLAIEKGAYKNGVTATCPLW